MGFIIPVAMAAVSALGSAGAAIGASVAGTAAAAGGTASALTLASAGLSAAGALYGGIAADKAGKYQAKVLNMNAAIADRDKENALAAGNQKESRLKMEIARTIGSQRAAEAANGVDVDVGSSVDIANSSQLEGAADLATIHYQTMQEAYGFSQQAWSNRAQAKMDKASGRNALIKGVLGAGASLLGGASSLGKIASANSAAGISASTSGWAPGASMPNYGGA